MFGCDFVVAIEFFPASQHQSASTSYGIYTWYFLPQFEEEDIDDLVEQIENTDDSDVKKNILRQWIVENYYEKYWLFIDTEGRLEQPLEIDISESWMNITPNIHISANFTRNPKLSDSLLNRLYSNLDLLRQYINGLSDVRTLPFLSPLYIGMAERGKSSIRGRLSDHYKKLVKNSSSSRTTIKRKFNTSTPLGDFATRASIAGVKVSELWFSFYEIDENAHEKLPDSMENFFNRLTTPALGAN